MRILFRLIIYLKNSISCVQKQYFFSFISSFVFYSIFSIQYIYYLYSFSISEKISILFKQYIIKLSKYSFSIQLIMHQNAASMFISLNSIILYLNNLNFIQKAIFYLFFFLICIRLQAFLRLIKVNYFLPQSQLHSSMISSKSIRFLIEILFSYQQLIISFSLLFFLGINITGYPTKDLNIYIYSFFSIFSIYFFKALNSILLRLYIKQNYNLILSLNTISRSYSIYRGNLLLIVFLYRFLYILYFSGIFFNYFLTFLFIF